MRHLKFLLLLFTSLFIWDAKGQIDGNLLLFNPGFERTKPNAQMPDDWRPCGQGYTVSVDTAVKHSGEKSLMIASLGPAMESNFGCVMHTLDAQYEGSEIELRLYIKFTDVKDGTVDVMLRIDGKSDIIEYGNLQDQNLMGTIDWKLYSIKIPLSPKAGKIQIFAILNGEGKMWVDDMQLLVDGRDISEAKIKEEKIFPAEKDHAFDSASGITSIDLAGSKLSDMVLLGKVWGFLKYYHPNVAAGNYNWDYELFRVMQKVLASSNSDETKSILSTWIKGLGEFEKDSAIYPMNTKLKPDLAWISSSGLGQGLFTQLLTIRNAKRTGEHYYIALDERIKNPEFTNENPYSEMAFPDAGYRMLALFRYWNIIQYYYPNRHLITGDWNKVLEEYIPAMANVKDPLEYRRTLLSLIARISDTHAHMWNDPYLESYYGPNYAPIKVSFVGSQAVIADFDQEWVGKTGLKRGDIIESIDNKPMQEIVKESLPYSPASNYPTQLRVLSETLMRTHDTILTIGYKRGNTKMLAKVACYPADAEHIYRRFQSRDTCFKMLPGNIAYIYPGTIMREYLPGIMYAVSASKGLIIDLRCYPSDFIVHELCNYLLPKKAHFVLFSAGSLLYPGLFTIADSAFVGSVNPAYYKGKIVILVNEKTVSQSEYTTMALQCAPGAMVIGSTTAGADGNLSFIQLPGGVSTMISGIGVYYPDGRETQRVGIVPDLLVQPTVNGIATGKDEVLDKAVQIIGRN